jgi:hypothetical protein
VQTPERAPVLIGQGGGGVTGIEGLPVAKWGGLRIQCSTTVRWAARPLNWLV